MARKEKSAADRAAFLTLHSAGISSYRELSCCVTKDRHPEVRYDAPNSYGTSLPHVPRNSFTRGFLSLLHLKSGTGFRGVSAPLMRKFAVNLFVLLKLEFGKPR